MMMLAGSLVGAITLAHRFALRPRPSARLPSIRTSRRGGSTVQAALLSELTALGLTSGLTFSEALRLASHDVDDALRREVATVLRRAHISGMSVALSQAGHLARPLYRVAARAMATGAPLVTAIESLADEIHRADRADARAAAQRLPVRLLFPLAFLVLPGFMILTVGPAVLEALERIAL